MKRKLAILELLECSKNWSDEIYTKDDFTLDKIIREHTSRGVKEIGKPPYDFMKL